jgi:hypothetical protein
MPTGIRPCQEGRNFFEKVFQNASERLKLWKTQDFYFFAGAGWDFASGFLARPRAS